MAIRIIRDKENEASIKDYTNIETCLNLAKAYNDKAFSIAKDIFCKSSQEYKCVKSASVKTSDAIGRIEKSLEGKFGKELSNKDIHEICHQTYDVKINVTPDAEIVHLVPLQINVTNNNK